MRAALTAWRAAIVAIGLAAPAAAFVPQTVSSSDPTPIAWDLSDSLTNQPEVNAGAITFRINAAGSDDVTDGSEMTAVEAAFSAWQDLPGCSLAFTRGADTATASTANDQEFPVFWTESSTVITQGTADTSDDVDIAGALAVTFTWWATSGLERGEIVDANVVFNGAQYSWTTDPVAQPTRFDIQSTLTHEIGHAIGLGHSPIGGATMFPRTAAGRDRTRTPATDDAAGASGAYPSATWAEAVGRIEGFVRDGVGAAIPGAHVVAEDADGNVVAGALTLHDGSYALEGLPPGDVEVWAEPLDPSDGSPVLFSASSLPAYYRGPVDLGFRTTAPSSVAVSVGLTAVHDVTVVHQAPSRNVTMVGAGGFSVGTSPAAVNQGATDVLVTVAAPAGQLPTSGTPLSITGSGITVKSTSFGTFSGGTYARIAITVDADAVPGLRSLVVDDGAERTVAAGHLEVLAVAAPTPTDTDGDTILDTDEGDTDSDHDGDPNSDDPDSDGDGILDAIEAGDANVQTPPVDTDHDGARDFLDLDSDADGLADATEGVADVDQDGRGAWIDADRDGGGEPDGNEAAWSRNPDLAIDDVTTLPGEVPDGSAGPAMIASRAGSLVTVVFASAPRADWHHAYRGRIADLASAPAAAIDCNVGGASFTTPDAGDGQAWYYLVTGLNWVGEGSAGAERHVAPGCP